MVQDSLVEYISSQTKLGVAREAIKAALVGAGWQAADVEDTLKKVEGSAKPAMPAGAMGPSVAGGGMGASARSAEPQSIRVSDLISSSGSGDSFFSKNPAASVKPAAPAIMSSGSSSTLATIASAAKGSSKSSSGGSKPFDVASMSVEKAAGKQSFSAGKKPIGLIIAIVVAVIFAAGAGYLYFENTSLGSQVTTLNSQSANITSQVTNLTTQVATLNASNTALTAENASLSATNADLLTNLSFVAAPPDVSSTASVSISGSVVYIKPLYVLTTSYGVTAYVKNSSDAQVAAALKPLLAGASSSTASTTVTLTGTHDSGSSYITVTAVNGTVVQ
jgi:hypothetical protein